ncbi:MAG: hypothetical protein ACFFD4_37440 [Candidatus Odinarchaeota archaeon]
MVIKGSVELENKKIWDIIAPFIRLKTTRRPVLYLFLLNKRLLFLLDKMAIFQHESRLNRQDIEDGFDSDTLQIFVITKLIEKQWNLKGIYTFASKGQLKIESRNIYISAKLLQSLFSYSKSTLYYSLNVLKSSKSEDGIPFSILVEREFPGSKVKFFRLQERFYEILDEKNMQLDGALEKTILLELQLTYHKHYLAQLMHIIKVQHELVFNAANTVRRSQDILKNGNSINLTRVRSLKERIEPIVTFIRFLNKRCRELEVELDHALENFDNIKQQKEFDEYYKDTLRRVHSSLNVAYLDFMQKFLRKRKKNHGKYLETFCSKLGDIITGDDPIRVLEKINQSIEALLYTEEAHEELRNTASDIIGLENLMSDLIQ